MLPVRGRSAGDKLVPVCAGLRCTYDGRSSCPCDTRPWDVARLFERAGGGGSCAALRFALLSELAARFLLDNGTS